MADTNGTPPFLIVLGQFTWQASHGGAVFIYIFLNKTMRKAVVERFLPRFIHSKCKEIATVSWFQRSTTATKTIVHVIPDEEKIPVDKLAYDLGA
ncbi:CRE-SRT-23 protein [Aphelenchoides avenae]|nr:CRE-SRT-23 protein [Aphelenchus avenae]